MFPDVGTNVACCQNKVFSCAKQINNAQHQNMSNAIVTQVKKKNWVRLAATDGPTYQKLHPSDAYF